MSVMSFIHANTDGLRGPWETESRHHSSETPLPENPHETQTCPARMSHDDRAQKGVSDAPSLGWRRRCTPRPPRLTQPRRRQYESCSIHSAAHTPHSFSTSSFCCLGYNVVRMASSPSLSTEGSVFSVQLITQLSGNERAVFKNKLTAPWAPTVREVRDQA